MQDELFSPTIRDRHRSGPLPWRPESILYPAFFGGPLAAATLGVLNGRRLGLARIQLLAVAAAGVVAFAARLAVSAALEENRGIRFAGTVAGVLVWLVVIAVQRRPFRAFTFGNGEPASLVGPGFAAAIGCGLLEAVVIFGLIR
jgi:hypothetical protein